MHEFPYYKAFRPRIHRVCRLQYAVHVVYFSKSHPALTMSNKRRRTPVTNSRDTFPTFRLLKSKLTAKDIWANVCTKMYLRLSHDVRMHLYLCLSVQVLVHSESKWGFPFSKISISESDVEPSRG